MKQIMAKRKAAPQPRIISNPPPAPPGPMQTVNPMGSFKVLFEPHNCKRPSVGYPDGTVIECKECKSLWIYEKANGWKRLTYNNERGVPFEHPMEVLARD